MFVILLKYVKPLEEVQAATPAHREFLGRYYENGTFIVSGRQKPPVGGVILCKASTREEVEAITHQDPFYIQGIAEYTIIEFDPVKYAPDFAPFLSK
jgi:uncharacterized protein YciI